MSTEPEAAQRAWVAMSRLVHDRDRKREVSDALGMGFSRIRALWRLAESPRTGRELADLLLTDAPFVTVVVDDLTDRGLVTREPHPTDRRAKLVTLTPAGRRAATEATRLYEEPPRALTDLPPTDLATLERILTSLTEG